MVSFGQLLSTALDSIMRNRMRSLLTALGIIIGVSAVIIMVAIGEGSERRIQDQINSLGTNLIIVFPGTAQTSGISKGGGSLTRFTFDDVQKLKKESTLLSGVSPVVRTSGQVVARSLNWVTSVYGVSPDYFSIRDWQLESGNLFTERDVQGSRKVVLLGKTVADNLYPSESAVGKQVRIRNTPFQVIGVLKEKGQSGMGEDRDDLVIAPSTTVFYRLKGGQFIDMINASAVSLDQMEQAQSEVGMLLRESHRITGDQESDFTVRTQAEITEMASATAETMTLLLGSIAGVSLLVGGIGIMNIMLVTVTERTREIGVRRAVGARANDILAQFLTEAAALSLFAGIIGILVAAAASAMLNSFSTLQTSLTDGMVAIAFFFSAGVGVFFGYYPARKAASLNPIEALRYE
jgi:putative ABC transport system permease protein